MAYKILPNQPPETYATITRVDAEKDLTFCGFIIAECPLKPDTKRVIKELKESNHIVKMITGDNQLTAAYIASQLRFGQWL
mmetsp:Transcript_38752/g.28644  ORF Transcript_38752/g.28644 Transcript_38752/m.28644 type:complete len:81 (-) Transcript_38752:516-758(-)